MGCSLTRDKNRLLLL